jgi:hypothetical protein
MRELSKRNRELLFVHLHKSIEETAAIIAKKLLSNAVAKELAYPPNAGLTEEERAALARLGGTTELESGIRKVLAHVAAAPLYQLLCLIDGIADPDGNGWTGVSLLDKSPDDVEGVFLNTEFMDRYWCWRRIRPDRGWTLDTYAGPSLPHE